MKRIVLTYIILACAWITAGAQARVLTLEECKSLASGNDVQVRNAELDVLAARAQKQEALAEYFPSISATAMAFHALNPLIDLGVTDVLGTSDRAWEISGWVDQVAPQEGLPTRYRALRYGCGATVSVTQPVFAGGRIVAGNRLAALGVEAAELKKSLRLRDADSGVEDKFWLVVSLQEKKTTLDRAKELLDSLEKDVCSAVAAGLMTESDLMQVRLGISELRSSEVQLRGGMRLAKMDLLDAAGVHYAYLSAAADAKTPYIDDVVMDGTLSGLQSPDHYYMDESEMAARMEETRLLELQQQAKTLEKRMVVGETLPTVGVGAMYGYGKTLGDGRLNGAVYAMVKIPLSDWGKASRKIRRYDYEVQKARNEQEYLDARLVLRARQLWIDLNTCWEKLQVARESLDYARDVYAREAVKFSAGMVTTSDLLRTHTELRRSEDAYVDCQIAYRTALNSYLLMQD